MKNTTHIKEPIEPNAKSKEGQLLETISLRDYFAAKAMVAICSDPHHDTADMGGYEQIAKYAYSLADSMLEARK